MTMRLAGLGLGPASGAAIGRRQGSTSLKTILRGLACVLVVIAATGTARSQTTFATMTGTVSDPSGAAVPEAAVEVTEIGTGFHYSTQANQSGIYTLPNLREGTYRIHVTRAGLRDYVAEGIELRGRDVRRLDVRLTLAEVATSIDVSVAPALIETETTRISNVRSLSQMTALPLNQEGQGFLRALAPGAVKGTGSTVSFYGSVGANQSQLTTDGTQDNLQTSNEWIQEIRFDIAGNSAEYGTLANISAVSKSGANNVHGSGYEWYSSPILWARDPFSPDKGTGVTHNYGFSIGGPAFIPRIYNGRNRTFFFAAFEASAGGFQSALLTPTVPLAAWKTGDFSNLGIQIRNPFTGEIYKDGRIPSPAINPVSQKIQNRFYPDPNWGNTSVFAGANFRQDETLPYRAPYDLKVRLDHRFSDKDFVYARFSRRGGAADTWSGALPAFGMLNNYRRMASVTASYTHIFTPTLSNEIRYGHFFDDNPANGPLNGQEVVGSLGITGLAPNLPNIAGVYNVGFSGLGISGISQTNSTYPGFLVRTQQAQDQLSFFHGKHFVKIGVDLRNLKFENAAANSSLYGAATFANTYSSVPGVANSGSPYADFLFGVPTSVSRAFPPALVSTRAPCYDFFVQDDWKVTSRLTLNLGMRYELEFPSHAADGRLAVFDPTIGKIVVPDAGLSKISPLMPKGYVEVVGATSVGLPDTLFRPDRNNFAPRFGFAFRPGADNRTVVRGGFGIYYDTYVAQSGAFAGEADGAPFTINEPSFTNTTPTPTVVLPQAFPVSGNGGPTTVNLPTAINPNLKTPYSMQGTLTIERQQFDTGFRLSYITTQGRQLGYSRDINAPAVDGQLYINKPRPFPKYPAIALIDNGASHSYNALNLAAERKSKYGVFYQFSYTFAHDIGDYVDGTRIENPYNLTRERATSSYIPNQRAQLTAMYEVPFGRHRALLHSLPRALDAVIGGWELSTITILQTGQHLNPTISMPDPTGTAFTTSANRPTVSIRADALRNPNLPDPTVGRWFDPSAFAAPPIGRFGTSGRNVVVGPGENIWHAALAKEFTLSDGPKSARLRIDLSALNVFNHPNWANPSVALANTATVGTITGTGGPNGTGNVSDKAGARYMLARIRLDW